MLGNPLPVASAAPAPTRCSDSVSVVGYSDLLNKNAFRGQPIGGLSAIAFDSAASSYVTIADRAPTGPAILSIGDVTHPRIVGSVPLRAGASFTDTEGLAVLPDGSYAVSSETVPSIGIFNRSGRQVVQLAVPLEFRVAPAGLAQPNKTLEGLTVSPSGNRIVAAMEGALAFDDPRDHRFADYRRAASGRYELTRQLIYRAAPGMRISDVAAVGDDELLVMEASYAKSVGNAVVLTSTRLGPVGGSSTPRRVDRRVVADLASCPTLGAKASETQRNPLLDNYEGLAATASGRGQFTLRLISDDNFSTNQVTRLLTLSWRHRV